MYMIGMRRFYHIIECLGRLLSFSLCFILQVFLSIKMTRKVHYVSSFTHISASIVVELTLTTVLTEASEEELKLESYE